MPNVCQLKVQTHATRPPLMVGELPGLNGIDLLAAEGDYAAARRLLTRNIQVDTNDRCLVHHLAIGRNGAIEYVGDKEVKRNVTSCARLEPQDVQLSE